MSVMRGYRKFIAYLVSVLSATSLVVAGFIDSETYQMVMVASIGAYIAGNVVAARQ